jgi:integrase
LRVVVRPSGVKTFSGRYRRPRGKPDAGMSAQLIIGQYPIPVSLAEARKAWASARADLKKGIDPGAAKIAARVSAKAAATHTVKFVACEWLKKVGAGLRSYANIKSRLDRLVLPVLGNRPVASLKPNADIRRLHEKIAAENGPAQADKACSHLVAILNWQAKRSDDHQPPVVRGLWKKSDEARERMLSDNEIRAVWTATTEPTPYNSLVRFLLLTGARRSEATGLTWKEIDDERAEWLLPARRNKVKLDLIRPLSKASQQVLANCPRIGPYPFGGLNQMTDLARPKARLDQASGVTDWVIHDLRRVCSTLMGRARVDIDIRERCLGHAIGGIRKVYDRFEYLDQKREAFERLSAEIARIVDPPADNVVSLAGHG